jgi:hypothetical protein
VLDDGELCDDGNSVSWDGCTACIITEFRVNEASYWASFDVSVDITPAGRFVIAWDGNTEGWFDIYSQVFNETGLRAGPVIQVSDGPSNWQLVPDVALNPDGDHVVVWNSGFPGGFVPFAGAVPGAVDIFGQKFDRDGSRVEAAFQINDEVTSGYGSVPNSVLLGSDWTISAFWTHLTGDEDEDDLIDDGDVMARRFGDDGWAHDAQTRVNSEDFDRQHMIDAAGTPDDTAVVIWGDFFEGCGTRAFSAQWFGSDGSPAGEEIALEEFTLCGGCMASIDMNADGRVVLAWDGHDMDDNGIYVQVHESGGSVLIDEITVNETEEGTHLTPSVAVDSEGGFVVVWSAGDWTSGQMDIWGKRFDSSGEPAGPQFRVNERINGTQEGPKIAMADDGRFVVVWRGEEENRDPDSTTPIGIFAQKYDSEGNPLGMQPW